MVEKPLPVRGLTHYPVVATLFRAGARNVGWHGPCSFQNSEAMAMRTEDKIRKRLEQELARVNQAIVVLKKEPRAEELEGFGDNTPLSEEVDASLAIENSELKGALLSRYLDRAAALDEARHRLDSGTYGICLSCGKLISPKRLSVVPEAIHCTPCQEEAEKHKTAEIHAHEWRRAEEALRERLVTEGPEPIAITGRER
jgi:DnaK suppressor protein